MAYCHERIEMEKIHSYHLENILSSSFGISFDTVLLQLVGILEADLFADVLISPLVRMNSILLEET